MKIIIKKKSKPSSFDHLMENDNRVLTEDYIDKNWNLEHWNDKAES